VSGSLELRTIAKRTPTSFIPSTPHVSSGVIVAVRHGAPNTTFAAGMSDLTFHSGSGLSLLP
jgi:hypothetical protein